MSLLIFTHANSFCASTYQVMFDSLRQRGFVVKAVEKFGHDPDYPVSNNWPHLVRQLADFVRTESAQAGQQAYLVGHSFGGFVSLMCAARHPELARAVLLLDSPILGGWKATALGMMKRTQLVGAVSPGKVSRARRHVWASEAEALAHFEHKKAFAKWNPQVLAHYIQHGTRDEPGVGRVLSFEREIETAIYNTLPDNLDGLIRRHPLKCPVAFIGGRSSREMRQVGMQMTQRVTKGRICMVDGSHLFPMEKPIATAAMIEGVLKSLPN